MSRVPPPGNLEGLLNDLVRRVDELERKPRVRGAIEDLCKGAPTSSETIEGFLAANLCGGELDFEIAWVASNETQFLTHSVSLGPQPITSAFNVVANTAPRVFSMPDEGFGIVVEPGVYLASAWLAFAEEHGSGGRRITLRPDFSSGFSVPWMDSIAVQSLSPTNLAVSGPVVAQSAGMLGVSASQASGDLCGVYGVNLFMLRLSPLVDLGGGGGGGEVL